jgi:hypothetical protein
MIRLPFGVLPGHWGLKGRTRDVAQAEYELSGYDLAVRLLEIDRENYSEDDFARRKLDLDLKYQKITDSQYRRSLIGFIKDPKQASLAELELDLKEGKVSELEYAKRSSTIKDEPWVTILNMSFGGKNSLEGSFELDWNDQFVEKLRSEGYAGPTPDNIVNQWFMEVCKNVALEEFEGVGNFAADAEANLETIKRWSGNETGTGGRRSYQ